MKKGDFRELLIPETFDIVVAFEALQHIPYSEFRLTLTKLSALSNRYVLISLPARVQRFELSITLPTLFTPRKLGLGWLRGTHLMLPNWEWPRRKFYPKTECSTPYYCEVGEIGYPRSKVLKKIVRSGLKVLLHKYNQRNPYHLFILTQKAPR